MPQLKTGFLTPMGPSPSSESSIPYLTQDDSGEGREGLNVKRKSGRGRKKVVTESEPPEGTCVTV